MPCNCSLIAKTWPVLIWELVGPLRTTSCCGILVAHLVWYERIQVPPSCLHCSFHSAFEPDVSRNSGLKVSEGYFPLLLQNISTTAFDLIYDNVDITAEPAFGGLFLVNIVSFCTWWSICPELNLKLLLSKIENFD